MAVFIAQPWLALIPASLFMVLYRISERKLVAGAASAWLLYAAYEYAMRRRWLCSGECNIRVVLLLLYPLLLLIPLVAGGAAVLAIARRHRAAP